MGSLHLIIGPMYSGKTTQLMNLHDIVNQKNNTFIIDYDQNIYCSKKKFYNHDNLSLDCYKCNNLDNITNNHEFIKTKYIFINEGQFFANLKNWVIFQIEINKKNIVICGLDSDFKREKFGELLDLVPFANTLNKMYGKCHFCKNRSLFSMRITENKNQIDFSYDKYIQVCTECYLKNNKN